MLYCKEKTRNSYRVSATFDPVNKKTSLSRHEVTSEVIIIDEITTILNSLLYLRLFK